MSDEFDVLISKSALFNMADGNLGPANMGSGSGGKYQLMDDDTRLPKMPGKLTSWTISPTMPRASIICCKAPPTRIEGVHAGEDDSRLSPARHRQCHLHQSDHGYWGAQLIERYVDEEVTWAVRAHQALRFFPDEWVGYAYPEMYVKHFGRDYEPDDYIKEAYKLARDHRWYMSARMITVHDIYSFDLNAVVRWKSFEDIVGRNFKQPKEGLGFDNSCVAHMWRTIRRTTKYL